jgi:cytochrome c biogenesis protein CcmG, thiol:disulfide interchange protein DsbE
MAVGLRRAGQVLAVAVVLCLLALLAWRVVRKSDGGAAAALRRGEHPVAPNFSLARLDRPGTLTLSALRGKAVVLNFWASWCLPCKKEAPLLEAASKRWRSKGVVVVGVDANDFSGDARRFMGRYDVTYPVVHDGQGAWIDDYGLTGFPETFFVRPDGRLSSWTQGQLDESEIESGIRGALRP